jgi:osmotically-inducible protein OsmY
MKVKSILIGPSITAAFAMVSLNIVGCAMQQRCASSECLSDVRITAKVEAQLHRYPDLGPPNLISVETHDLVVYLSGSVSAGEQSRAAESVVAGMPGVARVVNTIFVAK